MSKIQLDRDSFLKYLILNSLGGQIENKELFVQSTEEGLISWAATAGKTIAFRGFIKGDFKEFGDLGIDDLIFLRNFVGSTKEETFTLKKTENKLASDSENVKFKAVLRNPKYITNIFPEDKYKEFKKLVGDKFTLKPEDIKKIIQNYVTIKASNILFSSSGGILTVVLENLGNEISLDFPISKVEDFELKVPSLFIELLGYVAEQEVTLSMQNDLPIYLQFKNENLEFEYFAQPMVKN